MCQALSRKNHALYGLAALLLILTVAPSVAGTAISSVPTLEWQILNTTVGGRLQVGVPFARPCFSTANVAGGKADAAACASVSQGYMDSNLRVNSFGSYMNTEWETCQAASAGCLLDFTNPANVAATTAPATCSQGSVPSYYIDVRSYTDVFAAYVFSKLNGVTLAIKNTGHDYKGRSSAPESLGLWTHNLQSLSYNAEFLESGCTGSSQPAVTMGAGVTWDTLYAFADSHNITIPGGGDPSVGAAGGFLQGGGHSIISNAVGLAVDRVLEYKVATPRGDYITANRCQNTDMFFALRGGGGGTFGVVLEVTTKALPKMTIPTVYATFTVTPTTRSQFLQFVINNSIAWAQEGWGGYIQPNANIIFTNPLINETTAIASMEPLKDFVLNTLGGNFTYKTEPSYLSLFNDFIQPNDIPVGLPFITASRLVPATNFQTASAQSQLLDALNQFLNVTTLPLIFAVSPYAFKDDGQTSVTPAWRSSLWHVTGSTVWNFNTPETVVAELYQTTSAALDPLRQITPTGGAYQNEADVHEPDYQNSFWGSNYAKLASIKTKYDPFHILDCWQCVGWKGQQNAQYKCYV